MAAVAYNGDTGVQVGHVTRAEAAALHLVEGLQRRLRHVTGQVSRALSRPKVLSLEGLQPLVLGKVVLLFTSVVPLLLSTMLCLSLLSL